MPNWSAMGHAMRRRAGMPMSHNTIGSPVNRNLQTPEEVIASAEHANSPRKYVGMATNVMGEVATAQRGTLIGKKNTQAADPTAGGKANRTNVPAGNAAASERMGARYRVTAKFPAVHSVEAAATMANARIVPSVAGRQAPNFESGIDGTY